MYKYLKKLKVWYSLIVPFKKKDQLIASATGVWKVIRKI